MLGISPYEVKYGNLGLFPMIRIIGNLGTSVLTISAIPTVLLQEPQNTPIAQLQVYCPEKDLSE